MADFYKFRRTNAEFTDIAEIYSARTISKDEEHSAEKYLLIKIKTVTRGAASKDARNRLYSWFIFWKKVYWLLDYFRNNKMIRNPNKKNLCSGIRRIVIGTGAIHNPSIMVKKPKVATVE